MNIVSGWLVVHAWFFGYKMGRYSIIEWVLRILVLLHDGDLFPFYLIVYAVLSQELHDSGQVHIVVNNAADTYLSDLAFIHHVHIIPA